MSTSTPEVDNDYLLYTDSAEICVRLNCPLLIPKSTTPDIPNPRYGCNLLLLLKINPKSPNLKTAHILVPLKCPLKLNSV
jgi:hypothetical protein